MSSSINTGVDDGTIRPLWARSDETDNRYLAPRVIDRGAPTHHGQHAREISVLNQALAAPWSNPDLDLPKTHLEKWALRAGCIRLSGATISRGERRPRQVRVEDSMPLLMRCSEIQPGMALWEPLMVEGQVLLTTERALSASAVDTLKRRCPDDLVLVADDRLDKAAKFERNVQDRCVAHTVCHKLRSLLAEVYDRFESSEHPQVSENDIAKVRGEIAEVMQYLKFHHVSSLQLPPCTSGATFLTDHLANVVYTSLVFGSSVRSYIESERQRLSKAPLRTKHLSDLSSLALGAAFLDVGMSPLRALYASKGPITPAQRDAVRRHCDTGVDMMPVSFSTLGRTIIRGHHEKADGTGYPEGVDSRNLHVFLRITHIADAFNACTSPRVFPEAGSIPAMAWRMSRGFERNSYDPTLTSIFLELIRPFPIGARVQLTDGRGAIVVRRQRGEPFHPVVLIAFDEQDQPIDPPVGPIALATEAGLGIRSIDGEDLGFIYGRPGCLPPPTLTIDSVLGALHGLPETAPALRPARGQTVEKLAAGFRRADPSAR